MKETGLDKVLKHHARTCNYYVFSGDRHCSCGRDDAIRERDEMVKLLKSYETLVSEYRIRLEELTHRKVES